MNDSTPAMMATASSATTTRVLLTAQSTIRDHAAIPLSSNRLHALAVVDEILADRDHGEMPSGRPRNPHAVRPVGDDVDRMEAHDSAFDRAHADDAVVVQHENSRRNLFRHQLLHGDMDVGADAGAQLARRDWAARLRCGTCASCRRRGSRRSGSLPCDGFAGHKLGARRIADLDLAHFVFGNLADCEERFGRDAPVNAGFATQLASMNLTEPGSLSM